MAETVKVSANLPRQMVSDLDGRASEAGMTRTELLTLIVAGHLGGRQRQRVQALRRELDALELGNGRLRIEPA